MTCATLSTQWQTVPLGEIAEFRNGVNFVASQRGRGIPVLNVKDFQNRSQPDYADLEQLISSAVRRESLVHAGDILFVRSNGNKELIGRSMYVGVEPPTPTTHSAFTIRMRIVAPDVEPQYCAYFIRGRTVRQSLSAQGSGTNIANLNQDILSRLEISLPSVDVQRRIAGILSGYDDLIEANSRRIAIMEEMARRLFDEWFIQLRFPGHVTPVLTQLAPDSVPADWVLGTVGTLTQYINRGIAPTYDDEVQTIVINQKCIRDGRLGLKAARKQSRSVPDEKIVRRFDVLINSTGIGTLGRVAQVLSIPCDTTVDSHVTIVRPHQEVDPHYFAMQVLALQDEFERAGIGSTGQTELGRTSIANTPVLIPPKGLQDQLGHLVGPMRDQIEVLSAQNEVLQSARDLLLPKLISGEIDLSRAGARG